MNPSFGTPNSREHDSRPVIFLVDDETMLLELNAVILEPLGYQVQVFCDPVEAERAYLISEPRPALLVTDYAMPGMNGMDLILVCRRANPGQKIILLSGTVDQTIFRDAPEKPDRFLAKPYQYQQFVEAIRELVEA